MQSLNKVASQLMDKAALEYLGFSVDIHELTTPLPGDPRCGLQDEVASTIDQFCVNILQRRLQRMLFHYAGYPGLFAKLLSDDPAMVSGALEQMAIHWKAWLAVETQATGGYATRLKRRSLMNWIFVRQVFLSAAAADFQEVTPFMLEKLNHVFAGVGQTAVVESSFQKQRLEETRASTKKTVAPWRQWLVSIRPGVLAKVHRFAEVPYRDLPHPSPQQYTPLKSKTFYAGPKKHCRLPFDLMVADTQGTPWCTSSPQSIAMLYGELAAITNAYQNGSWGSLSHHWLSTMLQPGLLAQTAADPSSWQCHWATCRALLHWGGLCRR